MKNKTVKWQVYTGLKNAQFLLLFYSSYVLSHSVQSAILNQATNKIGLKTGEREGETEQRRLMSRLSFSVTTVPKSRHFPPRLPDILTPLLPTHTSSPGAEALSPLFLFLLIFPPFLNFSEALGPFSPLLPRPHLSSPSPTPSTCCPGNRQGWGRGGLDQGQHSGQSLWATHSPWGDRPSPHHVTPQSSPYSTNGPLLISVIICKVTKPTQVKSHLDRAVLLAST